MSITFEEYYNKFNTLQNWINSDLTNSSIYGHANFLVAMGIFNYIEFLGSFYKTKDSCEERFNYVFQELLPTSYRDIFYRMKNYFSPYDCLRCGMVHEYFVKMYSKNNQQIQIDISIFNVSDKDSFINELLLRYCGLEFIEFSNLTFRINIHNAKFIHDLNAAFNEYKVRLVSNQIDYQQRFILRSEEIRLDKL